MQFIIILVYCHGLLTYSVFVDTHIPLVSIEEDSPQTGSTEVDESIELLSSEKSRIAALLSFTDGFKSA